MIFRLAIYDSTHYASNSFWCYREVSLDISLLEGLYRLLVVNQDIANLAAINRMEKRIGISLLDDHTGVIYRIFPGQETSRLSSVVIALVFDRQAGALGDVLAVLKSCAFLSQYIADHEKSNGVLACPLKAPHSLVCEIEIPQLTNKECPFKFTPFSASEIKTPDFKSDRHSSSTPWDDLLATLHTYTSHSGELVCTAHFNADGQAELHTLWLPMTIKKEYRPPEINEKVVQPKEHQCRKKKSPRLILITVACLTIVILVSLLIHKPPPPPQDHILLQFAKIDSFAFPGTRSNDPLTAGEVFYTTIGQHKTALKDFEWLLENGNLQAKCYALVALRDFAPEKFSELASHQPTDSKVVVYRDGKISKEPFSKILTWIRDGEFSRIPHMPLSSENPSPNLQTNHSPAFSSSPVTAITNKTQNITTIPQGE